jgi:hypothetical protein
MGIGTGHSRFSPFLFCPPLCPLRLCGEFPPYRYRALLDLCYQFRASAEEMFHAYDKDN